MIHNACDQSLDQNRSALPNVATALDGWMQQIQFIKLSKNIVNHEVVEYEDKICLMAVRQPMNAQTLELKPEGQRQWKWETIHALPDVELMPDDRIKFDNSKYRVMEKLDFTEYGYIEYHIVQDYEDTP